MLIPSRIIRIHSSNTSLSRRVNANSQPIQSKRNMAPKLIKKGEC